MAYMELENEEESIGWPVQRLTKPAHGKTQFSAAKLPKAAVHCQFLADNISISRAVIYPILEEGENIELCAE